MTEIDALQGIDRAVVEEMIQSGQLDEILLGIDENALEEMVQTINKEAALTFGREGFKAFFHYIHGSPLHEEGEKWNNNIFDAIESGTKKMLQEAFRGSGKTTVFSKIFLAYYIGHFPHTTNGVIRVNGQKANETTAEVKELIESDPRWKDIFPHIVPDKDRGWGEKVGYFVMRTDLDPDPKKNKELWKEVQRKHHRPSGATFIGYGYDSGSIQGFRVDGVLLIDDIHDKENTRAARQMEDVKQFIVFQLMPIPVPKKGVEIWNFTPWKTNDAYAARKATRLYTHSRSPAMWKAPVGEGVYWPKKFGNVILDQFNFPFSNQWWYLGWPERWGLEELALKYADIGHVAFSREYLLDLEATKGQRLKGAWLHKYPETEIDPTWPRYFGIDYASVADKIKHQDRDYFVLAVMVGIPWGGLILEDGYRGHLFKGEALQKTVNMASIYPTLQLIGVESIGKGEEFYNDLVLINDVNGVPLPLIDIKHGRTSKGDRFENWLAPRFQMSRIWVSTRESPFMTHFNNEWLMYPDAEHDDCLDGAYMAAFAGEGNLPSKVNKNRHRKKKNDNPYTSLGRHYDT